MAFNSWQPPPQAEMLTRLLGSDTGFGIKLNAYSIEATCLATSDFDFERDVLVGSRLGGYTDGGISKHCHRLLQENGYMETHENNSAAVIGRPTAWRTTATSSSACR